MSRPRRSTAAGTSPLRVLVIVLLFAAVAGAGWAVWLYWGSGLVARESADAAVAQLRDRWQAASDDADPGSAADEESPLVASPVDGVAEWIIRIPALGETWEWPVAVGIGDESLAEAVGWYPGTSQPGQLGNFAVAGQCITGAQPFRDLRTIAVGDVVVVEAADAIHTYTITSAPTQLTVSDDDPWVLEPVPGQADAEPTQAFITLTTCEDLYPTPDRSVAFGVLTTTEPKP